MMETTPTTTAKSKSPLEHFVGELAVDIVITVAIVWGLVLLGEPLHHILVSPVFIVLTALGIIGLIGKTLRGNVEATPTDD